MNTPQEKWNAADLLDRMRPEVEKLLQQCKDKFGDKIPDCPSQSMRALRCLDAIAAMRPSGTAIQDCEPWLRLMSRLERFVAVHKTVVIMEYIDRHPDTYDCFGYENQRQT